MIVGNWMQTPPMTIGSDILVVEAKRLISENSLHALPVVEKDGRLRGLITRANLLRTGHFVMRTQSPDEMNFFVNRLRVRDIMVRNPATVAIDETIEECLRKARQLGVAQFPVIDKEKVVGIISANELFQLAGHCFGAWERGGGVTLGPLKLASGVFAAIANAAESGGAILQAIYPIELNQKDAGGEKLVILRFSAEDPARVLAALEGAGFAVVKSSKTAAATHTIQVKEGNHVCGA
jgi:acetoin utilization protein AcuB